MKHQHHTSEQLRARMETALSTPMVATPEGLRENPLAQLEEVGRSGPLGALLEAWATAGDTLSFYQARIADENALSTAHDPVSAYAIARGVGHVPRPAISASADLAFFVGAPPNEAAVTIPAGFAVGNVPKEGALPAIFETGDDLIARKLWNEIAATPDDLPGEARLSPLATRLTLSGTLPVVPGDAIVVRTGSAGSPQDGAAIIADATIDVARDRTLVRWRVPLTDLCARAITGVLVFDTRVRVFGALAPPYDLAAPSERRKYALGGFAQRAGQWSRANDGLDASPFALAALRDGWCGITSTTFVRWRTGERWTAVMPAPGSTLQSLAVSPAGRIAVGTTAGDVYVSSDDGDVWLRIGGDPAAKTTQRLPSLPIRAIAFDERGEIPDIYVATDRGVARIALSGNAWTWCNDGFPGTDPKTGYAACAVTSIVRDGAMATTLVTTTYGAYAATDGHTWTRIDGLGSITHIDELANGRFVACGPGGVFLSTDGARTWGKVIEPGAAPRALAASGDTIAVAAGGDVYASDDAGTSWWRSRDVSASRISALAVDRAAHIGAASPLIDNPLHEWPGLDDPLRGTDLWLDRALMLVAGDVIVIGKEGSDVNCRAYRVVSSTTRMHSGYGMSALATHVILDIPLDGSTTTRDAVVFVNGKSRLALRVRRGELPPPDDWLPVTRTLPQLPRGRAAFLEGRAPQALLNGLAGASFVITFDGEGHATVRERDPECVIPDRDASSVVAIGDCGAALARFDGVWRCDDLFAPSPAWTALPQIEPAGDVLAPTSVAYFDERIFCVADGRAFVFDENTWQPAGTMGAIRRIVSWDGAVAGAIACADRGAFVRDAHDSVWEPAPGLAEVEVYAVAAEGERIVAGTSGGVFVRSGSSWQRLAGLVPRAVHAVAIDRGTIYAGTAGAGLWRYAGDAWEFVRSGDPHEDIRAIIVIRLSGNVEPTVITSSFGGPVRVDGVAVDAGLTGVVAGFVATLAGDARIVTAFRGTPRLGAAPGRPLRVWRAWLDDERAETDVLDAGMMTGGFRDRLAARIGTKLDAFDVVVEAQGQAWRLKATDDAPALSIRRGARKRLDVFEVVRVDVRALPVALDESETRDDPLTTRQLAIGDGPASEVRTRESEWWYVPARARAPVIAERVTIADHAPGRITFHQRLTLAFDPRTASLLANVAPATHGARIPLDEPIASGDPNCAGQTALLARKPLTFILLPGDTTPTPAIDVWVRSDQRSEIRSQRGSPWRAVAHLTDYGARDRVFTVQTQPDSTTGLTFGDGIHGTRLPRGTENVVASYRFGAGPDGNVAAGALTLVQKMLPYIENVRNPLPASGGTAADTLERLIHDVPIGLVCFDRIVSQRDLGDFVRAFPGIAKADIRRSGGPGRFAVTIACRDGDRVDKDALTLALRDRGAAHWSITIRQAERRSFGVTAQLIVSNGNVDGCIAGATAQLLDRYGFDRRDIGADITAAEIIELLQNVKDVLAVRLLAMHENGTIPRIDERILGVDRDGAVPAILTIDPAGIELTAVPSA